MPEDIPLNHKIALGLIPGIGDINARKIVAYFGSAEAVFHEKYSSLIKIPGIGPGLARLICDKTYMEKADREADFVTKHNIKTFFYLDSDYPFRLSHCDDSPVVFFYLGNCNLNATKILSVVGTRNATSKGKEICDKIIGGLAEHDPNIVIVSGLAYGIDVESHKAALRYNLPTTGVLAHGLRTMYPAAHKNIAEAMIKNGGLITDFTSDILPERSNFIKRNRIIAGLSDASLIIESGLKGGALITADIASSYNRDVFAVPGRPGDQWSAGCNALIKNNKAALVESADDIEYFLNWTPVKTKLPVQTTLFDNMSDDEQKIIDAIYPDNEADIDTICRTTGMPISKLSPLLLQMEMKGIVKFAPGNIYRLSV